MRKILDEDLRFALVLSEKIDKLALKVSIRCLISAKLILGLLH
jgi:hypothetical protein